MARSLVRGHRVARFRASPPPREELGPDGHERGDERQRLKSHAEPEGRGVPEHLHVMAAGGHGDREVPAVGEGDPRRRTVQDRLPAGEERPGEHEVSGRGRFDVHGRAIGLKRAHRDHAGGPRRAAVLVASSRQHDVGRGTKEVRPGELKRPGQRRPEMQPARPPELGRRTVRLEEHQPPSGDRKSGDGVKTGEVGACLAQHPPRPEEPQQPRALLRLRRRQHFARDPVDVTVGTVRVLFEEIAHRERRAGRGDHLLELDSREPGDRRRKLRVRAAALEHGELGQPGRNIQASLAPDRRQKRRRAGQVFLVGGDEERKTPRKREEERGEPERVAAPARRAAGEGDGAEERRGRDSEDGVSPKDAADRGEERRGRRREAFEVRTYDPVERPVLGGGEEAGEVQRDEPREQERLQPAAAMTPHGVDRETRKKRHAEGRQQVELDRVAQAAEEVGGVEKAIERQRESEREEEGAERAPREEERRARPEAASRGGEREREERQDPEGHGPDVDEVAGVQAILPVGPRSERAGIAVEAGEQPFDDPPRRERGGPEGAGRIEMLSPIGQSEDL